MGADLNGLPFMGFIEALSDQTGEWERVEVMRYRNQPTKWRAWRACPPNWGTKEHPCSVPPPSALVNMQQPDQIGSFETPTRSEHE